MLLGLTRNQLIIGIILIVVILYYVYSRKMRTQPQVESSNDRKKSTMNRSSDDPELIFYNFMNPGCGWCKKLEPTWAKLEEMYKNNPKVSIRKIDATKPENEQIAFYYNITSYPTLILVTPTRNLQYVGDRSLTDLTDFITQHMSK